MKLYDCTTAPSPRRVRIFLAEKGIELPTVQVDLRSGEHLQPPFRAVNPYCTVPALELDDGTVFRSTAAIWRYLEETHPEPPLMGRSTAEKALIADAQWRIETDGFGAVAEWLRNSVPGMKDRALTGPEDYAQIPELAQRGQRRAEAFFERLAGMAVSADPFLCGKDFSVADIDALVVVDFARRLHLEPPAGLTDWYALVSSRPSARA